MTARASKGDTRKAGQANTDAQLLAAMLTSTPNLRAKFFADPTRQAGRNLPPAKFWDYTSTWYGSPFRYRRERALLAKSVLHEVANHMSSDKSQAITASVSTDAVFEEYFAPIVKVSQRSFTSVYYLSIAAFITGLSLIGIGTYLAIVPHHGTNSTVVSSIFGGSGAISALGAVYAMATHGIREATLDHARVRLVMTAFATQLGQLRAAIETPPADAIWVVRKKLNDTISQSMKDALAGIPLPNEKTADDQKTTKRLNGRSSRKAADSAQTAGATGASSNGATSI